jgi:hypothetical protein
MLAPITTACSPIRFMMNPALVTSVNPLRFRWYGAKTGSVLVHRLIWQSRICQRLESQSSLAADGRPNTLT